jgi:hypothetical protein
MFTVQQLERIAKTWRQDAESEHDKYYFETAEFRSIADGTYPFVISRKGTGKSAIVMHLKATAKHAVDLSLSDLDPQHLHRLGNHDSPADRALLYRNTFAYIIYRAIAVMMLDSPDVAEVAKKQIRKAFPDQAQKDLPRNVMRWVKLKGHFEALEVGGGVEIQREKQVDNSSIVDKKNLLEQFVATHLKGGPYYVIFDALDDNYHADRGRLEPGYGAAITSLFKTVADIRQELSRHKLFPVITLRDDIFEFLQHAERTRWRQRMVEIKWSEEKIKEMVAYRMAATTGQATEPFEIVWPKLVGKDTAKFNSKEWQKYAYIASFTMLRPRDFITYLSVACDVAVKRARERPGTTDKTTATLSVPVLKECNGEFADYFRNELEDELGGQIPDIKPILDAVLAGPNRSISRKDLETRYKSYLATKPPEEQAAPEFAEMMEKLYQFGVIGCAGEKFRFNGGTKKLPPTGGLLIHKGLIRSRDEDKVLFGD